ncbi:MAG: IS1595 family transposase [Cytophagales bacterium]|nr:MAG: IS1595 family transposase [Cytophagales bacterium]
MEAFKGENEILFKDKFATKEACMSYLAAYRWKNGFECPHCKGTEESNCTILYHKRCKKCNYIVSATANTLFHKVKFGLEKAFLIIFKMSATTKSISAEQLAKNVGINRKTALLFQQKVRVSMKSSEKYPLKGCVEVDEAFIGEQETGAVGRGAVKKSQIVVAIEKNGGKGTKRMYVKKIENASSEQLKPFFEKHISTDAKVMTDKWSGYFPLKKEFQIDQQKSKPKENFKVMHRGIQQLKSWIRGIHHSVNPDYLQGYLNEFCYRINRSIFKESIFDNLLNRMMLAEPCAKNQIKFVYCN